ncbi:hypothetical protein AVEN_153264-1 [Araneus ventricosus]|uniref:Uncharacterized protein n=1 Tax=Araneus ventricosus TaxID=182803 RepID=A0A4Y2ME29_ARAVE|nr:hypothetical protein AVEN_153264-1 [Araneus ventricosus]
MRKRPVYLIQKEIEYLVNNFSDLVYSDSEDSQSIDSERKTESEHSADEDENFSNDCGNDDNFHVKNFKWCKKETNRAVGTPKHSIVFIFLVRNIQQK